MDGLEERNEGVRPYQMDGFRTSMEGVSRFVGLPALIDAVATGWNDRQIRHLFCYSHLFPPWSSDLAALELELDYANSENVTAACESSDYPLQERTGRGTQNHKLREKAKEYHTPAESQGVYGLTKLD